jgi:peptide/nickel transport system ATP-binding protein
VSTALLDMRHLVVRFRDHEVVSGLSMEIHPGETLALVGESGSGKSATALAIMRLVPPPGMVEGGNLLLDGIDLLALPEREMRRCRGRDVAMVFQEPMTSLNPVMTVGDQIVEMIREHRQIDHAKARARSLELLELVRLPDPKRIARSFPHQLSGGMRQRIVIAIAVAAQPRLLIADEPTTALDVTVQAQIMELLENLKAQLSMGLLLITHDMGLVAQWADNVVVLYAGQKVEAGYARDLLANPIHPYSEGLANATIKLHANEHYKTALLSEITGDISSALGQTGCAFAPRCRLVQPTCRERPPPLLPAKEVGHHVACPPAMALYASTVAVRPAP